MGFGGGGGGFMGGGPSSASSNMAAGLPFAGIPAEMAEQAEKLAEKEPEHSVSEVGFTHSPSDKEKAEPPFTLTSYLAPYKPALAGATLLVILESLMLLAGPLLIQLGIDRGAVPGNLGLLLVITFIFVGTVILGAAVSYWRISYTGQLSETLMYRLRLKIFTHLQRLSMSFYTREKTGVVMSRMTSDVEYLTILFQEGLVNFVVQGLTFVIIVAVLFYLNPLLAGTTIVVAIPVTFILSIWFKRVSNESYGRVRNRTADVLSHLSESLGGIRIIKAHNRELNETQVHSRHVGQYKDANIDASNAAAKYTSVTEGVGIATQAWVLGFGGWLVATGRLSIGELTAFGLYVTSFFAPIQTIVQLYNTYQQGQSAAAKLRELLAEAPSVLEPTNAVEVGSLAGKVSFESVGFSYGAGSGENNGVAEEVLSDINLEIQQGETLAIVGPTGGGKSTIAKLICRFYDPTRGQIKIDGKDLRQLGIEAYRSKIAVVPQEPFLFHGSIADNLRIASPDASDEELMDALASAGLADLISHLPLGIDTPCHERGASFSAGERQLLALARVFVKKPQLLILDEATSNLDLKSESKVERAFDLLLSGKTAILIAHRLSTALRADRIAVVEEGRIVELGTHLELQEMGGRYSTMYETWLEHGGK